MLRPAPVLGDAAENKQDSGVHTLIAKATPGGGSRGNHPSEGFAVYADRRASVGLMRIARRAGK
jgi:hypothetical protein